MLWEAAAHHRFAARRNEGVSQGGAADLRHSKFTLPFDMYSEASEEEIREALQGLSRGFSPDGLEEANPTTQDGPA
ncbi:hypothetical protein [Streptomyces sp. PU-14G]|uniref:hypothetical protein n=1 Tax=Streptomyces sp. PU-14G TaxID=2800808 RepID=UPI0034DF06BD